MSDPAAPDAQFLYLTTTGRCTGRPRQIEIWFVASGGRYYVLAEHFHQAQWVQNILREPRVRIRVGSPDAPEETATARVLDAGRDPEAWHLAQRLAREKYGWGEGLPVEITPVSATRS
ncbi:MAG: nitroreductase family deazaflavin-dependent oxidoreductase [Armatimonadota bacterium]|nr:nitroreductase family deazaflavin-dependent oxidoreductase [Armatimonadota bacterium]MDR7550450.1 nitroreductase family deazaflavin-dependent oxidoreductase [Armatimonadota bacterium]